MYIYLIPARVQVPVLLIDSFGQAMRRLAFRHALLVGIKLHDIYIERFTLNYCIIYVE